MKYVTANLLVGQPFEMTGSECDPRSGERGDRSNESWQEVSDGSRHREEPRGARRSRPDRLRSWRPAKSSVMTITLGDGSDMETAPAQIGRERHIGQQHRDILRSVRQHIRSGRGRRGHRILPATRRTMTWRDKGTRGGRLLQIEIRMRQVPAHRRRLTVNRNVIATACPGRRIWNRRDQQSQNNRRRPLSHKLTTRPGRHLCDRISGCEGGHRGELCKLNGSLKRNASEVDVTKYASRPRGRQDAK